MKNYNLIPLIIIVLSFYGMCCMQTKDESNKNNTQTASRKSQGHVSSTEAMPAIED